MPAEPTPAPPDASGKVIHFDASGEAEPYKVSGWSGTEAHLTWTLGKAAVLAFPAPPNSGALKLRMYFAAFTHPPELPYQPVEVYANGQKVAEWQAGSPAQFTTIIPKEIVAKANTLTLELRTPKATSPATFTAKGDPRTLGISCFELELTETP